MKRISLILILIAVFTTYGISVFADMGIPDKELYRVVVRFEGAEYSNEVSDKGIGTPAGTIPGGSMFSVWREGLGNTLYGTTDELARPEDRPDKFVYIRKEDVIDGSTAVEAERGTKTNATIIAKTTDDLNLRCGPGTGFDIITVLDKDTELTYDYTIDMGTTWMYVNAGDQSGWVSGDYLQKTGEKQADKTEEKSNDKDNEGQSEERTSDDSAADKSSGDTMTISIRVRWIAAACVIAAAVIAALVTYLLMKRKYEKKSE